MTDNLKHHQRLVRVAFGRLLEVSGILRDLIGGQETLGIRPVLPDEGLD